MALYSNDSNIRHINIYGLYEKEELEMLFNFFIKFQNTLDYDTCLDIGLRDLTSNKLFQIIYKFKYVFLKKTLRILMVMK
jgi:hypothetical protein